MEYGYGLQGLENLRLGHKQIRDHNSSLVCPKWLILVPYRTRFFHSAPGLSDFPNEIDTSRKRYRFHMTALW